MVAEGRMVSVKDFSTPLSTEATTDIRGVVRLLFSVLRGDAVVAVAPFELNEVDDMSEGATVTGEAKKVSSSRVSRKSL